MVEQWYKINQKIALLWYQVKSFATLDFGIIITPKLKKAGTELCMLKSLQWTPHNSNLISQENRAKIYIFGNNNNMHNTVYRNTLDNPN